MTHGEEPGSETHQDSAVLTYLEGLLMHQVAGGPGATGARRSEAAGRDSPEQRPLLPRPGGPAAAHQEQDRRVAAVAGGASQHLRKARLLRSEGWPGDREAGGLRAPGAEPAPNRRDGEQRRHGGGALEGSPKCKGGESTLLASLLQSFSSRLQTVALSQQIMQNHKQPEPPSLDHQGANRESVEPRPCLGAASSRLKGFLKKSKMQNHASVPYRRRAGQERPAQSPQPLTSGGKGAGIAAATAASDSLSCAARLKAVASLVNTRSSPAPSHSPSPRPSVACSQLALLLSSEAHLQQYSREQALKAQLSGRSASERLAAMATQQSQHERGKQSPPAPDALASFGARNGTLSPPGQAAGGGAASPRRTPQPLKERRGFDRNPARPSQNCSSLLLHLLNNHNAQKHAGARGGPPRDDRSTWPSRGSPLLSDAEYSNPETSLPRDSSDTESSCSSSSPIDLSVRSRVARPLLGSSSSASSSFSSSSSSLDKLTESLINRWRPENPPPPVAEEKEPETGSLVRPHHKVTLLQLLLDHRNGEGKRAKRSSDNPDLLQGMVPKPGSVAPLPGSTAVRSITGSGAGVAAGRHTPVSRGDESTMRIVHGGPVSLSFRASPLLPQGNSSMSQYSQCPPPPAQAIPLNLCKSKAPSNSDADAQEPAFTASKLLQNLAQCGLQSSASSTPPLPPAKLRADPPVTLLERLNTPILRDGTPVSDAPPTLVMSNGSAVSDTPGTGPANPPSQIESLLERRTVLQLLLGATGNKEKSCVGSGRRKRAACGGEPSERRLEELNRCGDSPEVKIKMEPREDGRAVTDGEDGMEAHANQWEGENKPPRPLSAPHHAEVKPEPVSPGAVPRDGLLSQLLRQQCRNLPVNTPTALVKEESSEPLAVSSKPQTPPRKPQAPPSELPALPSELQAPPSEPQAPPIPKKRKVCIEGFSQERSASATDSKAEACGFVTRSPERPPTQNGRSPTEAESPCRGRMGNSPPADARGGFNVLKQLLLSDNCLKDLSQLHPRGTPSPSPLHPSDSKVNGTCPARPDHLHKLVASHHAPLGSGVSDPAHSGPLPWGVRDSPKLNLVPVKKKAETEGPIRWVVGVDESPDQRPDSPRLTKANPILYYMLQRGNAHLGRDSRGLGAGLCGAGSLVQPRVKEEPAARAEDDDLNLNSKHRPHLPEEAPEGAIERLNGSLKKC